MPKKDSPFPIALVEVLVLQRFPYGKDSTFFYLASGELLGVRVGDLVKIPWRKSEQLGVVVKVKKSIIDHVPENNWKIQINSLAPERGLFYSPIPHQPINLKPILQIVEKEYFTEEMLRKLRTAAKMYSVSWNHFAKSVTDSPEKPFRKSIIKSSHLPLLGKFSWTPSLVHQKDCFGISQGKFPKWIFTSYQQEKAVELLLRETIGQGKQVLVIVPEKIHLIPAASKYANITYSFGIASPIILSKFLPRALSRAAWNLTRKNEPHIFVSTRSGIFAPYKNLGLVILEDGYDMSHKQWDMSPLYDIRNLLELFYPQIPKIYLSDTPRLQDFFSSPYFLTGSEKGKCEIKKINRNFLENQKTKNLPESNLEKSPHLLSAKIEHSGIKTQVVLVNTIVDRAISKNENPISAYIEKKIISNCKKNKSALLLINHKGIANLIMCQDCGQVFRCPKCGKVLSQREKFKFECRSCGYTQKALERCPQCNGFRIVLKNPGIETVKEYLTSLKKKIGFSLVTLPESNLGYSEILKFTEELLEPKPIIVLGYAGVIPLGRFLKNRLGLSVILDLDEMLFHSDFRAEERAAARVYNLLPASPKVYIQTADPLRPILRKIITNPYSALFKDWLAERKNFGYPPYVNILRMDIPQRNGRPGRILDELEKNKNIIEAVITPVSGAMRKNKYQASIVVKYPLDYNIYPAIDNLIRRFGNMRIDPDPEEL